MTDQTPDQISEQTKESTQAKTALKGAFNIFRLWGLEESEIRVLLGNPDDNTYSAWQDGTVASLPESTLINISYLLGIYKALRILFPTEERAAEWPRKPNRAFGGASALDVMLDGRLSEVRRYLDGQWIDESAVWQGGHPE